MDQPSWLAAAWAEFGVGEEPGTADNPAILDYYREVGAGGIAHDETPWCAAFAGAMLKRGGYPHSGSLLARSYLGWGAPLDVPVPGAITILERDGDTNAGHVGFFVGRDKARVFILGGNQSNRVNVAVTGQLSSVVGSTHAPQSNRSRSRISTAARSRECSGSRSACLTWSFPTSTIWRQKARARQARWGAHILPT